MTGRADAPTSGVHTFTVNHSSDDVRRIGCGGGDPNSSALSTPSPGSWGSGAAKLSGPTGGCAYGIPRKACTPSCRVPRTFLSASRRLSLNDGGRRQDFLLGMTMMTISVRMLKNSPRIPHPTGVRPFMAATTPQMMAAMMLPIATKMPLMPRRMRPAASTLYWAASTTVCNIATSSPCTSRCRRITPCAVESKRIRANTQSLHRSSQNELDRASASEFRARRRCHVDLGMGLLQNRRVRVENRQIHLMRGEGRDRAVETVVVDHFCVRDFRPVLEQPARRFGERVICRRNRLRELDVVALVRCPRRPFRTAVDGEHEIRSQGGDRVGDLGTQLGCVADLTVREVPELHVVDADDGGRPKLFGFP